MDLSNDQTAQAEPRWTELRDVWAVVAAGPDGLSPADQGAIARARELADMLGCYARVLAIGEEAGAADAVKLGADYVAVAPLAADSDPAAVLALACAQLFPEAGPEFVLLGQSPQADALAPVLAGCLGAGLAPLALTITLDDLERALTVKQPVYDDLYRHPFTFKAGHPQVVVLGPDAQGVPYPDEYRSGDVQLLALEGVGETSVQVEGPAEYTSPAIPLTHAKAIVAVGRGLKDEEGLELARRLAALLGAELAGDHTARELGWVDEAHTVGLTGETVAPNLYVALGIHGGAEHSYGMSESRMVVALHPDARAPIFKRANVGWVGDVKEGLRQLIEALE